MSANATTATSTSMGFRLPRLVLPRRGVDLAKWAVIACDQYTSEPEYWQRVEALVADAPSTLHLIFPEVYLGAPDATARIAAIQQAMRSYLGAALLEERVGAVYVERTVDGRTRRGLMLELDLEHYDFSAGSTSLIRPTEGTMVARLAPRIEVRRGAELELPHVLVLIDDPEDTVIGPIAAATGATGAAGAAAPAAAGDRLARLYDTELMEGGGRVAGYAVDEARGKRAAQALQALAQPQAFARRYGVPASTPPMLFAMGDGNHSLATAKSIWEQAKGTVGMDHPSRWALVEVENIHDAALHFAPIHRVLFGVRTDGRGDVRAALAEAFGAQLTCTEVSSAAEMRQRVQAATGQRQAAGLVGPGARFSVIELGSGGAAAEAAGAASTSGLLVGVLQGFIDRFIERGGAGEVDYVHGDDVLERLAQQPGSVGFHLATVSKSELLKRVVHDGPLPRKTFSMGEAHEKRYYVEARRIR